MLLKLNIGSYVKKKTNYDADYIDNDVDDTKRGILSKNNCCSCLEMCSNTGVLKCCMCEEYYHNKCIKRPISDEVSTVLNENPSCWWICWNCVVTTPINHHNDYPSQSHLFEYVDKSLANLRTTMSNDFKLILSTSSFLDDFKNEMMTNIDSKLSSISALSTGSSSKGTKRRATQDDLAQSASKVARKSCSDAPTTADISDEVVIVDNTPNNTPSIHDAETVITNENNDMNTLPVTASSPSVQATIRQPHKFLLHYRPVSSGLIIKSDEWNDLRKTMSEKLSHTKILFSHFNQKTGKVVIGFPNKQSKECAVKLLKDLVSLWCFELYTPEKMLPKLTLHNVPHDFELIDSDASAVAQRDLVKDQIWKTIVDKNDGVKTMVENGSTLEIVYFRKHKYSSTVAIKVSPDLRLYILEKLKAKLYLFSSCCRASDRCHYQQCYHCLKYGHISRNCPKSTESPICMYCAQFHDSRSCAMKDSASDYRCHNCLNSKQPSMNFNHCACSPSCPSALAITNRIQMNTQLEVNQLPLSKNI